MNNKRKTRAIKKVLLYIPMIIIAIIMVFPFFWMLVSSIKPSYEFGSLPPTWWPSEPTFEAYRTIFEVVPFSRAILNSLIVTGISTLSILLTSIMAGYIFAKHNFKSKNTIFICVLSTMMVPQFILIIPLFQMMSAMGLTNSYLGLILPNLANAFGIFLMRQFIMGIPDELIESARIDGASEWRILWKLIVPLLRPASAALVLFAFVFQWNNFIWPLTIVSSQDMQTVVLALNSLRSYSSSVEFTNVVMAGAAIGILPSVILFIWLQKFFVEGIAMTGIKD